MCIRDSINTVDWPTAGEIDVMESVGSHPDTVSAHTHSYGAPNDPRTTYKNQPEASLGLDWDTGRPLATAFHTYALDYQPGFLTFSFDGQPYFSATPEDLASGEQWPFTGAPNYMILDLAMGGTWAGTPSPTANYFPASLLIRTIRITS